MTPSPIDEISPGRAYCEKCGGWVYSVFFCRDAKRCRAVVRAPAGTRCVTLTLDDPKPHQVARLRTEIERASDEHVSLCPYRDRSARTALRHEELRLGNHAARLFLRG